MKKNLLLILSLFMAASAFGMQQTPISATLGRWKNDTNKDLLISSTVNGQERTIAQLPARSEVDVNKVLQLETVSLPEGITGITYVVIKDPQNPQIRLGLEAISHIKDVHVRLAKIDKIPPFPHPKINENSKDLDVQEYKYKNAPAGNQISIQGTIRGNNFEQSTIGLCAQQ